MRPASTPTAAAAAGQVQILFKQAGVEEIYVQRGTGRVRLGNHEQWFIWFELPIYTIP